MSKFKVGDRVRIVDRFLTACKVGDTGIIKYIDNPLSALKYAVELDREDMLFSSCNCHTKDNRGQWVDDDNIELIEPEFKLVVISKGDKTKAKLYRGESLEKEVEVNRYHKDEYSEKAAVEAVTKKIFDEEEKEGSEDNLFNGNAVAVADESSPVFTITRGRVYKFINGRFYDDNSHYTPIKIPYNNGDMECSAWFVPIVE